MFELLYHPAAYDEILKLDDNMRGKTVYSLDKLSEQGNQLRYPHTEPLRNGLLELRAGGKDITRTIFAFAKGRKIYILRTFIKKTPKTPPSEIKLALSRLEEMIDES